MLPLKPSILAPFVSTALQQLLHIGLLVSFGFPCSFASFISKIFPDRTPAVFFINQSRLRRRRTRHIYIHFTFALQPERMRRDTRQALQSRVVFVNAPLERSESDSSARIGVSILREISIGTVQIFQYRYLSKYLYF